MKASGWVIIYNNTILPYTVQSTEVACETLGKKLFLDWKTNPGEVVECVIEVPGRAPICASCEE